MARVSYPGTTLLINHIELSYGKITDEERRVARMLLADNHARWVVAAMLGRFPLAFTGNGGKPSEPRRKLGGELSKSAARQDPRQITMYDMFEEFLEDLLGPDVDSETP